MPYRIGEPNQGELAIELTGDWSLESGLEALPDAELEQLAPRRLRFESRDLQNWDSSLLSFVLAVEGWAAQRQVVVNREFLPPQLQTLIDLALQIPQRQDMAKRIDTASWLERLGRSTASVWASTLHAVDFIGELCLAFGDLLRGRCRFRGADFLQFLNDCGPRSLGITGLISFLIGVILAFVGAMQLEYFGAGIYVASLVGVSMAREMASMMTGIIMAGRTGAAYAAQLGSMQVNEEIDALTTLGVTPFNYLVMPRLLALTLMMPLLTLYANFVGILGGALVSMAMLDLSLSLFLDKLVATVPLYYFGLGLAKSLVFGILVALSGCYMGMRCGRSATAVGQATTAAVVVAIVLIVVADSIFTVITTLMGI